jgi:hypothetical protein
MQNVTRGCSQPAPRQALYQLVITSRYGQKGFGTIGAAGRRRSASPSLRSQMRTEQRRNKRKPLRHNAWLTTGKGAPRIECAISDISDSGARIDFDRPDDIPDRFVLMFTSSGAPYRRCRVVWRSGRQAGVRFEQMARDDADPLLRDPVARSA